jgi:hypothetical protein
MRFGGGLKGGNRDTPVGIVVTLGPSIQRGPKVTSYANFAHNICVRVTSANPTQMLRAPAARGARTRDVAFGPLCI